MTVMFKPGTMTVNKHFCDDNEIAMRHMYFILSKEFRLSLSCFNIIPIEQGVQVDSPEIIYCSIPIFKIT